MKSFAKNALFVICVLGLLRLSWVAYFGLEELRHPLTARIVTLIIFAFILLLLPQICHEVVERIAEFWNDLPPNRMANSEIAIMSLGGIILLIGGLNHIIWLTAIGFLITFGWLAAAALRCHLGKQK